MESDVYINRYHINYCKGLYAKLFMIFQSAITHVNNCIAQFGDFVMQRSNFGIDLSLKKQMMKQKKQVTDKLQCSLYCISAAEGSVALSKERCACMSICGVLWCKRHVCIDMYDIFNTHIIDNLF